MPVLISIACSLLSFFQVCCNSIHNFPIISFVKSRVSAFAVSLQCHQTVTDPPIAVSRRGTPRSHPGCPEPVTHRCTRSVHRQATQGVPRQKPSRFFPQVHPGCPESVHL